MTAPARPTETPWVHEMVLVHRVFRSELALLPSLVSAVPDGDRRRARVLAEHYRFVTRVLHVHHAYEDENLWPLVQQRCPLDRALTERMEQQHARIDALLTALAPCWSAWEQAADPQARRRLAAGLADLSSALEEHLQDEEALVLPVLERTVTVSEWAAFGEHAGRQMDKRKGLFWLGLWFAQLDAEEFARVWAALPGWVRLAYRLVGEHAHRRGLARVRGTSRR